MSSAVRGRSAFDAEDMEDLAIIEKRSFISKIFAKIKKLFKGQSVEEDNII